MKTRTWMMIGLGAAAAYWLYKRGGLSGLAGLNGVKTEDIMAVVNAKYPTNKRDKQAKRAWQKASRLRESVSKWLRQQPRFECGEPVCDTWDDGREWCARYRCVTLPDGSPMRYDIINNQIWELQPGFTPTQSQW